MKPLNINPENWSNLQTRYGNEIIFIVKDETKSKLCVLVKNKNGSIFTLYSEINGRSNPYNNMPDNDDIIERTKLQPLCLGPGHVGKKVRHRNGTISFIIAYNPHSTHCIRADDSLFMINGLLYDGTEHAYDIIEVIEEIT